MRTVGLFAALTAFLIFGGAGMAQLGPGPMMVPLSHPSKPPASITSTDHQVNATAASSYSFTIAKGSTQTGRILLVCVSVENGTAPTISTVKIDTVSMTQQVTRADTPANSQQTACYSLADNSGTSGTLAVTTGAAVRAIGVGVWAAYGLASATATATASSGAAPPSAALTVNAGGVAVGYTMGATGPTYTWTNATKDFDETVRAGDATHSGAHLTASATVTATPSSGSAGMVLAAFR